KIISIFIIALTFACAACSIFIEEVNWKSFFSGLTGGFITMFITLLFFNMYLDEQLKKKQDLFNKDVRIKNVELITTIFSNQYNEFYLHTKQMLNGFKVVDLEDFDENFNFNDLKYIFDQNLIKKHGIFKTNVEVFFLNLKNIVDSINFILINGNFEDDTEIKERLVEYLNFIEAYNIKENLLEINSLMKQDPNYKNMFMDFINDENNFLTPSPNGLFVMVVPFHSIIKNTIILNTYLSEKVKFQKEII